MAGKMCAEKTGVVEIFSITQGVFNILSDIYLLLIPLPAVAKLRMSKRKKLRVYFIFLAGACACVMSTVALKY
ncbi:hypothetical protein BCR34DRAFT_90809 [Clohesyomyces aquaticus]|uniref:Rhodopsin domain-containing protein n=1 Tax=Clohesyomyces aquaticus TaxID=1231657 RepID=A0A1Y1YUT4_9PLEO|nr:hypothetical protein BCR34DRAFT_90809 [Clohesyomyces aquaticus]